MRLHLWRRCRLQLVLQVFIVLIVCVPSLGRFYLYHSSRAKWRNGTRPRVMWRVNATHICRMQNGANEIENEFVYIFRVCLRHCCSDAIDWATPLLSIAIAILVCYHNELLTENIFFASSSFLYSFLVDDVLSCIIPTIHITKLFVTNFHRSIVEFKLCTRGTQSTNKTTGIYNVGGGNADVARNRCTPSRK